MSQTSVRDPGTSHLDDRQNSEVKCFTISYYNDYVKTYYGAIDLFYCLRLNLYVHFLSLRYLWMYYIVLIIKKPLSNHTESQIYI